MCFKCVLSKHLDVSLSSSLLMFKGNEFHLFRPGTLNDLCAKVFLLCTVSKVYCPPLSLDHFCMVHNP